MENETNYVWHTLQPTHTRKNRQILNNRIFKLVWIYFFRFFFYQYRLRVKSDVVDQNVFMAFYWIYLTKAAEKNGLLIINCKNSIFEWKLKQPEKTMQFVLINYWICVNTKQKPPPIFLSLPLHYYSDCGGMQMKWK